MKAWLATAAGIFALVGSVWGGMEVLDSRYVAMSDLQELSVEIFFREYRDAEKALADAEAKGDRAKADEIRFRLDRLKGKICKIEPEWPRCSE